MYLHHAHLVPVVRNEARGSLGGWVANAIREPRPETFAKAAVPMRAVMMACLLAARLSSKKLRIMVPTAVPVGYGKL